MSPDDSKPARRATILGLLLCLGALACGFALIRGWEHRLPLAILWGTWWWMLAGGVLLSGVLAAVAGTRVLAGAAAPRAWPRELFCTVVVAAVLYLLVAQPFATLTFQFAGSLTIGVFATRVLAARWQPPRALELVVFNLCLMAVIAEVGLRTLAWIRPSPMLIVGDATVAKRIDGNRPPAGTLRWGFPVNAGGHYDTEFSPRDQRSNPTVAVVGDSFSAGVVPHPFHFTTVCEQQLADTEVYNVGVSAIGPLHYLHLVRTEVAPLQPDVVIVNLFIGNDVDRYFHTRSGWLHRWLDRSNVLLFVLPERMMAVARERSAQGLANLAVGAPQDEARFDEPVDDEATLLRELPWLTDVSLEQPTFSPERFVWIEQERAVNACGGSEHNYENVLSVVQEMRAAAAGAAFGVMLIPDEFQVEDRLWNEITGRSSAELDRDRPQRVLTELFAGDDIPVLDLLPVLRAQPLDPDGDRHLYHLRNTHFNARGNRVVGEALAGFVRGLRDG